MARPMTTACAPAMADTLARSSTAPAALHSRPANNGIKVLVLGGTQFIGRTTVAALVEHHFSVSILNRGQSPFTFGTVVDNIPCDSVGEPEKFAASSRQWDAIVDFTPLSQRTSNQSCGQTAPTFYFD